MTACNPFMGDSYKKSIETDVLSAGFARLLSAGHLRRKRQIPW